MIRKNILKGCMALLAMTLLFAQGAMADEKGNKAEGTKAKSKSVLIVGLNDNVKSNYFYNKMIAEETGISADSVSAIYNRVIAQNIVEAVRQSCEVPFERVLFALGIRYVGETVAKKLALALHSIEAIRVATVEELTQIGDIGERIAQSVVSYFGDEDNLRLVERLREYGVQMQIAEERLSSRTDKLSGATIVISGTFTHHSRDEYKALIEQHGGVNTGSVSGKTTYILAGENMGPAKLEKARKLGVRILSEEDFLEMIR